MQKAEYRKELHSVKHPNVKVGVLDWYNTAVFKNDDKCQEALLTLMEEIGLKTDLEM